MLQQVNNTIQDDQWALQNSQNLAQYQNSTGILGQTSNNYWQPYTYWYGYPVYVCADKTKKAIEVLKTLQAEKILEVKSVNKFIELVEKISNIL